MQKRAYSLSTVAPEVCFAPAQRAVDQLNQRLAPETLIRVICFAVVCNAVARFGTTTAG